MLLRLLLHARLPHVAAIGALLFLLPPSAVAQPGVAPSAMKADACWQTPPQNPNGGGDLWGAQETLIGKCIAHIPERTADRPNIYAVAIAPLGTQTLFSREARKALETFAANYGGTAKAGILLSNGVADLMQVPLATQGNVEQVLSEIGRRTEATPDDILVVYLTSHGGPDAVLQSALPGNLPILAISADSLASALAQSHVRRRVIIISACFAGSWIPKLANDDTIIITAAAKDRTSFGCADNRPLTYFGEAFLTGPFSRGASLAASFEGAKKTVSQWEEEQKLPLSNPQSFVGKNMQLFWQASPKPQPTPKKVAARR